MCGQQGGDDDAAWLREEILERYARQLVEIGNPIADRPHQEIRDTARPLLDTAFGRPSDIYPDLAADLGARRARQSIPPQASVEAGKALFTVALDVMADAGAADDLPPRLDVLKRLHAAIIDRIVDAAVPYADYLLEEVGQANHNERRRLARNLHDQLAQSIAVCALQLQLREIAVASGAETEAELRLSVLASALHEASDIVHDLASDLGTMHTERGLMTAIMRFISSQADERLDISVTNSTAMDSIQPWVIEELYFVIREALHNAVTHSKAKAISATIGVLDRQLRTTIRDDGVGIDPALLEHASPGKGLTSVRERVALIGGRVDIQSTPSVGTVVDIRVPLP